MGYEHTTAFLRLKEALANEQILGYFDSTDRTQVYADASPVGLGAVLFQLDKESRSRVIAYDSKSSTPTEKRYCQTEKEALA